MPFLSKTLTYGVFGPIILDYAPGEFFCWHFYAWRRGRILIMPASHFRLKRVLHSLMPLLASRLWIIICMRVQIDYRRKTNGWLPCTVTEPKEKGILYAKMCTVYSTCLKERESHWLFAFEWKGFLGVISGQDSRKCCQRVRTTQTGMRMQTLSMDEWKVAKIQSGSNPFGQVVVVQCLLQWEVWSVGVNNPWNDIQPNIHSLPQPPNLRD